MNVREREAGLVADRADWSFSLDSANPAMLNPSWLLAVCIVAFWTVAGPG